MNESVGQTPPGPGDWRRQGQESYLVGVELIRPTGEQPAPHWDHEHCAFCWDKIMLPASDASGWWSTTDGYHWVCERCRRDFQAEFRWVLRES